MSLHNIAKSPSTARLHPAFEHHPEQPSGDMKPSFTRAGSGSVRRDAGPITSRFVQHFSRRGSDEVFYPANHASRSYQPPLGVTLGARVPPVVNGQVPTIGRHVRERALIGLPETHQYVAPYEVRGQLPNGQNGRVFVSPLRAVDPRLPPGTVVTSAMDPKVSYF